MPIKGYLCIALAATLWGLIGPISRLAFSEGLQPMEVAFWRAALAWLFFGSHAAVKREISVRIRDFPMITAFALSGVALFYVSYQYAVNQGGAALAAVLLYTAPAWVAMLSPVIFKESMPPVKIIALCLTLAGITGVSLGAGGVRGGVDIRITAGAVGFGLTAGLSYSTYFLFGKYFSDKYSSPNLFFYLLPIGAAGIVPWVDFMEKTPTAWAALFCLAFLCTYAAYYLYYIGLKILAPTQAAITATLEPVMAGVIAFFWWDEMFSAMGYMGSALILSSVVLIVLFGEGGHRKGLRGRIVDVPKSDAEESGRLKP